MDRRTFLEISTLGIVATALGPFIVGSAAPVGTLERAFFEPLVGTWYFVEGTRAGLRLAAIEDGPQSREVENFALRFEGTPALAEGLYTLRDARGDRVTLFLQPAGGAHRAHFGLIRPLSLASCAG
jgi:hypothetical protein